MTRILARLGRRRSILIAAAALLGLLLADYALYPVLARPGGRSFNTGGNGLWLRYRWYFGEHGEREIEQLADSLRARQIRYAYVHVRSIDPDGRLRYHRRDAAAKLTATLRRYAPNVKSVAWIYVANRDGTGQAVDIGREDVRRRMVAEAKWLVEACGFAGIQWDYEVCHNGDRPFLELLRETHAALPSQGLLSVATPMWQPRPLQRWGWSDAYLSEVAKVADQLVVMCYDSGVVYPRAYVSLVRAQARHVTRAAGADPQCQVLLGLPTYGRGGPSHHARAENLLLALKGVREGLSSPEAVPDSFSGVSLFADYTTDAQEWETYRRWWLTDGERRR